MNNIFYKYLLINNLAYFYVEFSKDNSNVAKKIIQSGNILNSKFEKTVDLICDILIKTKISAALFKTYKHIPEVVDGDIDLLLAKDDMGKFILSLTKKGFECVKESEGKYICKNKNYLKIEPRTNVSFGSKFIFDFDKIKNLLFSVTINNRNIDSTPSDIDVLYFILNFLYGPNYLRLYHYFLIESVDFKRLIFLARQFGVRKEILFFKLMLDKKISKSRKFPIFLSDFEYLNFFIRFISLNRDFNFIYKVRHLVFFFFLKYKYLIFGKLHFRHQWNINL